MKALAAVTVAAVALLLVAVEESPRAANERFTRYAVALHKQGKTSPQVVSRLTSHGMEPGAAESIAASVKGKQRRNADTLHTVLAGFASRWSDAASASATVAQALCDPIIDEDGAAHADAAACVAAQGGFMAERWCETGQQSPVMAGARARMTADEWSRTQLAVGGNAALTATPAADNAAYESMIQAAASAAGFGSVERCAPND